jgi:hypothetical protein
VRRGLLGEEWGCGVVGLGKAWEKDGDGGWRVIGVLETYFESPYSQFLGLLYPKIIEGSTLN